MKFAVSAAMACALAQAAAAQTFSNTETIVIPALGPATPYPSVINVSGVTAPIASLTVKLPSFSHDRTQDVDILLVGPTGAAAIIMSDAGANSNIVHLQLTFTDGAAPVPNVGILTSGIYSPVDYEPGDSFAAPAPAGPFGSSLSVFNGLNANGAWQLFIVDDTPNMNGKLRGWSLEITPIPAPGATALLVAATAVVMVRKRRR